jgi:hypothetical protein
VFVKLLGHYMALGDQLLYLEDTTDMATCIDEVVSGVSLRSAIMCH